MPVFSDLAKNAAGVQHLRHDIYSKLAVTRDDLSKLIMMGRAAGVSACVGFVDLLADVAADLLVEQVDPPKYIQNADADWLIAQLEGGAPPGVPGEFRMLVNIIRHAVSVPNNLVAFTTAEIEKAVLADGRMAAGPLDDLRIVVFAATEGSSLHVTRNSAEALLRIAQKTAGAANDPGFDDFVAKAVANYLTGIAFHWTPKASEIKDLEKWLDEKPSFASYLSHMFGGHAWARGETAEDKSRAENTFDKQESAAAGRIDGHEADWLVAHLSRNGKLTSAEVRLLMLLQQEAGALPAVLEPLLNR